MKNWKYPPQNPIVAKYIDCYWLLEKEPEDVGNNHPKLNPDPAAHLILATDDYRYQYTQGESHQQGSGSHWIFPHKKTFIMDHSAPFRVLGIKFHVGALYSINHALVDLQLDKVTQTNFNNLVVPDSLDVMDLLAQTLVSPEQVRDKLDRLLLAFLAGCEEDKHSKLVRKILTAVADTPIAKIGETLHCSQRTAERSFLKVTQLTIKQVQSMNRLEQILNYLYKQKSQNINWANVANRFNFSDQPHLIRYLKTTIGSTPTKYQKQRDLTIDVYGNFES